MAQLLAPLVLLCHLIVPHVSCTTHVSPGRWATSVEQVIGFICSFNKCRGAALGRALPWEGSEEQSRPRPGSHGVSSSVGRQTMNKEIHHIRSAGSEAWSEITQEMGRKSDLNDGSQSDTPASTFTVHQRTLTPVR